MRNIPLLITLHFLLLPIILACGRKGDPVAIVPAENRGAQKIIKRDDALPVEVKDGDIHEISKVLGPPTGLVALYTGKGIILTWDEITDRGIRGYNIYRSTGKKFRPIAKTVTPAYMDMDVQPGRRYLYRIAAVGEAEGPLSEEIEVLTE